MLGSNDEKTGGLSTVQTVDEKPVRSPPPDTINNNSNAESSSATPVPVEKPPVEKPPVEKPPVQGTNDNTNPDGLIYADLDLDKSKDAKPPPERKDAVNYETIDFTAQGSQGYSDDIELASDEEELPSKK